MPKIIFNNGILKLNPNIEHEKKTAIFLAFSHGNADYKKYEVLEKSLPRIVGLRRKSHRVNYAFDLIENLTKYGYEIIKKEDK